jgi:hypothetical protein
VPDPEDQQVALWGCVEKDDGPAVAARVIAWADAKTRNTAAADPGATLYDTQFTDAQGRFAFGRKLAQGTYNLFFEDTSAAVDSSRLVQRLPAVPVSSGSHRANNAFLRLPALLLLSVIDYDTHDPLDSAECTFLNTPYHANTGNVGLAALYLPPGDYTVSCQHIRWNNGQKTVTVEAGSSNQDILYLRQIPQSPEALPPPQDFTVEYDANSGIVNLSWSPVKDNRLFKYGVRKVDVAQGGGVQEFTTANAYFVDAAFERKDTLQEKRLLYSVYSLKQESGGYVPESRSQLITQTCPRPWSSGPRIDTLSLLDPGNAYRAGDTVRIVAAWTNRIRGNRSLHWTVGGVDGVLGEKSHPPDSGSDTLAFTLPTAGGYDIGILIEDAEGYRSWQSRTFQFYGTQASDP